MLTCYTPMLIDAGPRRQRSVPPASFHPWLDLSSECFQTLLSLQPEDQEEGTSDAHPVVLPGIRARDFDYFLDYHLRQYVC